MRSGKVISRASLLPISALIVCCCSAEAEIYYADVNHPQSSDSNPGTDPDLPWKRCPGMAGWNGSASLQAGDTVYFNNSGIWMAGSGNRVVLQVKGGVTYDGMSWGSGTRAVFRAEADLSRSVISFMEDHPDVPTVVHGIEVDAGGRVTTGIGFNHPQMERPLLGAVKRVEDCVVHDVVSFAPDSYKYGIVVSNWGGQYQVANVEILNNKVYNISRGAINNYPGNDVPENWTRNVVIRGNDVWSYGTDPNYGGSGIAVKNHAIDSIVEFNHIHDPARGSGIGISNEPDKPDFIGPENLIVRHNIIDNVEHTGIYIQDYADKSAEIYGNIIMRSRYHGLVMASDLTGSISFKIYSNTFYQNYDMEWSQQVRISCGNASVRLLEVKNNLFHAGSLSRALLDDDGIITSHSNNLYFRPGGGVLVIADGTSYTAANIGEWEPSAIAADPLLNDTSALPTGFIGVYGENIRPEPEGLNITPGSPARDAAAVLGAEYDTSINSIRRPSGAGWDVGAYELSLSVLQAPARLRIHN